MLSAEVHRPQDSCIKERLWSCMLAVIKAMRSPDFGRSFSDVIVAFEGELPDLLVCLSAVRG